MKQNEYIGELERINCYLKKCLWMDFEVYRMNLNSIEIAGRIDEGVNQYAISILFDQPYFIQGPMCFSLDTSRDFINLLDPIKCKHIIRDYVLLDGYNLFQMGTDDQRGGSLYISALNLSCVIHNPNPFV